jgi:hypothetical protein
MDRGSSRASRWRMLMVLLPAAGRVEKHDRPPRCAGLDARQTLQGGTCADWVRSRNQ